MRFIPIEGLPKLRVVPFNSVHQDEATVWVDYDDENGTAVRLVFEPFQAIRVTTADCFLIPQGFLPHTVVEVVESPWVAELKSALQVRDRIARFMDRAHHYLVPGGDAFVEVVAGSLRRDPSGVHGERVTDR